MDVLSRSSRNFFVDRRFRQRPDGLDNSHCLELCKQAQSRFLVFCQGKVLLAPGTESGIGFLNYKALAATATREFILLDHKPHPVFALEIQSAYEMESVWRSGGRFVGLREAALILNDREASYVAAAKALLHWQRTHRYCGRCGSRNNLTEAGHVMTCSDAECAQVSFPRVDPAIIVLIEHRQRCLLGRQAGWAKNRYSCLAGFVEPGESVETALRREAYEEAGIDIDSIRYHSSQPWPFPQSVMLGFLAHCKQNHLVLRDGELEHALWFSRQEILAAVQSGDLRLPSRISISYRLLEDWYDQAADMPLQHVLKSLDIH